MTTTPRVKKTRTERRKELKNVVFDEHGSACFYCGKVLVSDGTLDHLIPESLGGKAERSNLVPACNSCNQDKANLTLEGYRRLMWERSPAGQLWRSLSNALDVSHSHQGCLLRQLEDLDLQRITNRLEETYPLPIFAGEIKKLLPAPLKLVRHWVDTSVLAVAS